MQSSHTGSSPRVRGTPYQRHRGGRPGRFIPACAGNAAPAATRRWRTPVHPRVCGERHTSSSGSGSAIGSSPRVRGTPSGIRSWMGRGRFIPACAGNAPTTSYRARSAPVHPRVCGERHTSSSGSGSAIGSSPRVRGTPSGIRSWMGRGRFIPACAGNAPTTSYRARSAPVHPRVCGERFHDSTTNPTLIGSSPRVRGTRRGEAGLLVGGRFIPACAGNARASGATTRCWPVHPRVCGERAEWPAGLASAHGSSPRVRGTPGGDGARRRQLRFIPACAGNAWAPRPRFGRPPVHPRVCGERAALSSASVPPFGSSPRVRGTREQRLDPQPVIRFIPACAGNAGSSASRSRGIAVHPRVCGERSRPKVQSMRGSGSSPRVRGTLDNLRAKYGD